MVPSQDLRSFQGSVIQHGGWDRSRSSWLGWLSTGSCAPGKDRARGDDVPRQAPARGSVTGLSRRGLPSHAFDFSRSRSSTCSSYAAWTLWPSASRAVGNSGSESHRVPAGLPDSLSQAGQSLGTLALLLSGQGDGARRGKMGWWGHRRDGDEIKLQPRTDATKRLLLFCNRARPLPVTSTV